jgi:hypothetical protein
LWVAPILVPLPGSEASAFEVRSPNGQVALTLLVRDCGQARGCLLYRVGFRGRPAILDSRLGLELEDGPLFPAPPAGGWRILQERSEFRFVPGSSAYPIYQAEETFPTVAVPIDEVKPGANIPLTVRLPTGFASVLEADVEDSPGPAFTSSSRS